MSDDQIWKLIEAQLRDKWVGDPDQDERFERRLKAMRNLGRAERRFDLFLLGTILFFSTLLVGILIGIFAVAIRGHI